MRRNRITRRHREARERLSSAREIVADIDDLEQRIDAADDAALDKWETELSNEERSTTQQSTNTGETVSDQGDQNDKSDDNWPTNAGDLSDEERYEVASLLVKCAKLLSDED